MSLPYARDPSTTERKLFSGLTETSPATHVLPLEEAEIKVGSIGRLLPSLTARVVDADGQDVREGEAGEMILKGPTVMRCVSRRTGASDLTPSLSAEAIGKTIRPPAKRSLMIVGIERAMSPKWTRTGIGSECRASNMSLAAAAQISPLEPSIVDRLKELIKYKGFQGGSSAWRTMSATD